MWLLLGIGLSLKEGDWHNMKVLFVCSFNKGSISSYVHNQVESIRKFGIHIEYFLIHGKGLIGYLSNYARLRKEITKFKPDLIQAHYGFSGLLANLQRKVPVITTFHGSDLNLFWVRPFSTVTYFLSRWSVFVSQKLVDLGKVRKNYSIIPCGVDLNCFYPLDLYESREKLGYTADKVLILFSGAFENKVKNYPLARKAINYLNESILLDQTAELIELKGYSPKEVNLLLNACNVALLTSISEGSPNFIKEALACNRPIVSTDVGDVKFLIEPVTGCFIAKPEKVDIADEINRALDYPSSKGGRHRIQDLGLEIDATAERIIDLYKKVLQANQAN